MRISSLFSSPTTWIKDTTPYLRDAVSKVSSVAKNIGKAVLPHAINMSPWVLSRLTNMQRVGALGNFFLLMHQNLLLRRQSINPKASSIDSIQTCMFTVSSALIFCDSFDVFPHAKVCRVAVDSFLLLTTALGSARALLEGTLLLWSLKDTPQTDKIQRAVTGLVYVGLGGVSAMAFWNGWKLFQGIKKFDALPPLEQKSVIRHRVIHELAGEKVCQAVVIEGDIKRTGSWPAIEFLFQKCSTRIFPIDSNQDFCAALGNATLHFGSPISVLAMSGHSCGGDGQWFENHCFKADAGDPVIACMKEHLTPDAQIFLLGCNTATQTGASPSYAEKLSKALLGREITGFKGFYTPHLSWQSLSNGKIRLYSLCPFNSNWEFVFSPTVIYRES